jgi:hypothetical protein
VGGILLLGAFEAIPVAGQEEKIILKHSSFIFLFRLILSALQSSSLSHAFFPFFLVSAPDK